MAKGAQGLTRYQKQDLVMRQFSRIAREDENRKPTLIEQSIINSKKAAEEFAANKKVSASLRVSFYNPANPLNGSTTKSKAEISEVEAQVKQEAKAKAKAEKLAKKEAKKQIKSTVTE